MITNLKHVSLTTLSMLMKQVLVIQKKMNKNSANEDT